MYKDLFSEFDKLKKISNVSEGWGAIAFKGIWNEKNHKGFDHLISILSDSELNLSFVCKIDGVSIHFETFEEDLLENSEWEFNINKISRLLHNKKTFFYDIEEFITWSEELDCFNNINPLLSDDFLLIVVNGLNENDIIIANNYIISNKHNEPRYEDVGVVLENDKISSTVHFIATDNFKLDPKKLFIHSANYSKLTAPFFEMSFKSLSICLVSEFLNKKTVILRGIRKINLDLFEGKVNISLTELHALKDTVNWVYEDKTDLKLKLFLDRFTLDLDLEGNYIAELIKLNKSSLEQAKERYSFITFERKDLYQKELRELLKDLKSVSELYTTKVRSLLTSLLRDVLAGLFLIGITILSKVDLNSINYEQSIIELVFKAFGVYFIISILYQGIFDYFDLNRSKKEFLFWKQTSREYISNDEFNGYLNQTINKRSKIAYFSYAVLVISYFTLAYTSFNFTDIIETKSHVIKEENILDNANTDSIPVTKNKQIEEIIPDSIISINK